MSDEGLMDLIVHKFMNSLRDPGVANCKFWCIECSQLSENVSYDVN